MHGEIDIVVLPFMFVCTFVCGFLLNTCTNKRRVQELEGEVYELEWDLSAANHKIERITKSFQDTDSD